MNIKMNFDLAVLYLTKRANIAEIEEFESWLNDAEANREYYQNWAECWNVSGDTYRNIDTKTQKAWEIINKRIIEKPYSKKIQDKNAFWYVKIAASIALIFATAYIVFRLSDIGIYGQKTLLSYSSGNDTMTVMLPDGSKVCLNENSVLLAPSVFKHKRRQVYLEGEAFFDVFSNPKQSFIISAGNTVTEVLGTAFNLKAIKSDTIVSLIVTRGKVAFYKEGVSGDKLIMLPGQECSYNSLSGSFRKQNIENLNTLAWKTGKLEFKKATITELCKAISDFYKVDADYAESSSKAEQELFTGNFSDISLKDALSIIKMTMNVNIEQQGNRILVSDK